MNADTAVFLPVALIINVPEVDEQHAGLFARLARLKHRCIETNCLPSDDAISLLESLRIHCATEERLANLASLDFTTHAKKHQLMLKGIEKTLHDVRNEKTDIFSLIKYIEYWFERHIIEEDKELGRNLQKASVLRPEAPLTLADVSRQPC